MEATKIPASALLGGEFRHGPLEMVGPDFICIVYAHSQSGAYHPSIRLVEDVLSFKGKVILISDAASGIESPDLLKYTFVVSVLTYLPFHPLFPCS